MARKKLSEMTPYERVDSRMKGMSWEEAEDVGVEILAKCLALHISLVKMSMSICLSFSSVLLIDPLNGRGLKEVSRLRWRSRPLDIRRRWKKLKKKE